jgi:hypothetical protein
MFGNGVSPAGAGGGGGVNPADLADAADAAKGSALVGYRGKSVGQHLDDSQVFLNCHMTHAMSDGIRRMDNPLATNYVPYVGMTCIGDSFGGSAYTMGYFARAMQEKYGVGATFSPNLGQCQNGLAWTFAGGAGTSIDYTYFPGANQIAMPAGSTASLTNSAGIGFPSNNTNDATPPAGFFENDVPDVVKITYVYLKRPGDGQLTFTTSQKGVDPSNYPAQVVDCNGALDLATVDVPIVNSGKYVTVSVAAANAACVLVGVIFWRKSGVLFFNSNVGGSKMDDQKMFITNGNFSGPYKKLLALLKTKLIIHSQRAAGPADVSYQNNYNLYFDTFNTLGADPTIGGLTQLLLGEQPTPVSAEYGATTVTNINKFLRSASIARSLPYIDGDMLMNRAMAIGTQLGWSDGDTVHWDSPYHRWLTQQIGRAVDWFRSAANRPDLRPVTRSELNDARFSLLGFDDGLQDVISGNGQSTLLGTTVKGGTASFTASQSGNTLTVSAMTSGTIAIGQQVTGSFQNGTITGLGTGTGGVGTYTMSTSGTTASVAMTADAGYVFAPSNDYGYRFNGGVGLGYFGGIINAIPPSISLATNQGPISHSIQGYRGLLMNAGCRAHILFGVSSAKTTLTTLAERCYGIEFAKGSDVGTPIDDSYPAGQSADVMRIICFDGTNILTSEWTTVLRNGSGATTTAGYILKLDWDYTNSRLVLYSWGGSTGGYSRRLVLSAPGLKTATTANSYIAAGIIGENPANLAVAGSRFSFRRIVTRFGERTFQPFNG